MHKHMRNFILLIATVLSTNAYAGSGRAFIVPIGASYSTNVTNLQSTISMSNISMTAVNITIKFYNYRGTILTDDGSATTGNIVADGGFTSYSDNVSGATSTVVLPAHSTFSLTINMSQSPSTPFKGYGIIEWSS